MVLSLHKLPRNEQTRQTAVVRLCCCHGDWWAAVFPVLWSSSPWGLARLPRRISSYCHLYQTRGTFSKRALFWKGKVETNLKEKAGDVYSHVCVFNYIKFRKYCRDDIYGITDTNKHRRRIDIDTMIRVVLLSGWYRYRIDIESILMRVALLSGR